MNTENFDPSNRNKISRAKLIARRAIAGLALGTTIAVGGATAFEEINDHNVAQEEELLRDTTEYRVQDGGYISEVAAQLPYVEDTTYASKIISELNPDFATTNIIPDNTDIIVPNAYVEDTDGSNHMSLDLDNSAATIRR